MFYINYKIDAEAARRWDCEEASDRLEISFDTVGRVTEVVDKPKKAKAKAEAEAAPDEGVVW